MHLGITMALVASALIVLVPALTNAASAPQIAEILQPNDQGYNIADDASCAFTATGSTNSSATLDASLGALADNGGPTQTILPVACSPAIGQVPPGTTLNRVQVCPGTDQRGNSRPGAGETDCTIAAVEYNAQPSAATPEVSMPLLLPVSVLALRCAGYGIKRRSDHRRERQLSS